MKDVCLLRECQDYDKIYGIVILNNVSIKDFQKAIYDIKNEFYDNGYDNWCIMAKLSEIYDFEYYQFNDNDYLEI